MAQLPTDIREEPLFLAPMLRSCKASLARVFTLETLQLKDWDSWDFLDFRHSHLDDTLDFFLDDSRHLSLE